MLSDINAGGSRLVSVRPPRFLGPSSLLAVDPLLLPRARRTPQIQPTIRVVDRADVARGTSPLSVSTRSKTHTHGEWTRRLGHSPAPPKLALHRRHRLGLSASEA